MSKLYRLYCNYCHYKRHTTGDPSELEDLHELKTSDIQLKLPYLDPKTGKMVVPKSLPQRKKLKCPSCGRILEYKKLPVPEPEKEVKNDEGNNPNGRKTGLEGL